MAASSTAAVIPFGRAISWCLAGLERPDEGMIQFEGAVWSDVQRDLFVAPRKRRVGFVSQDYALFPHLTAERHIYHGTHDLPVGLRHEQVARMVAWLGLEGLEKRLPHELSGRQQQRGGARKGGGVPTLLTQQALPGA